MTSTENMNQLYRNTSFSSLVTQPWTTQAVASSLNVKFGGRGQEYKSVRWEAEDKRVAKRKQSV